LPHEEVVHKRFFSAFESGVLDAVLNNSGIDTIILAGVHEHGCIRAAALDAYVRGLRVLIVAEAVASDDPLHAAITRRYLEQRAAQYLSLESLVSLLDQTTAGKQSGQAPRLLASVSAGESRDDYGLSDWVHVSPRQNDCVLWRVPICGTEQVSQATTAARRAQGVWNLSSLTSRVEMLQRFAILLEGESEVLAQQMAHEIGKPVTQGRAEVARAVALIQTVAGFVDDPLERRCTTDSVARFRALGTVAMITPWNNPLAIPVGKIAPALFYGNAAVWKPSPPASAIASRTLDLLKRAGCPKSLVNMVCGDHSTASILMNDVSIDAVTFTGAIASGYAAQEICARRHIPLQAELGGNNAAIVWHDSDLEDAARKIAEAAFGFAGQRCTANRRVIVEESCYDAFLQHLEAATRALNWSDPCVEKSQIGPLISRQSQQQSSTRIERAQEVATQILTPHEDQSNCAELLNNGAYFLPTIVCCDNPTAEIVQEESFAPILVVQRAADWDEAMRLCNGVRQGLAAALFSDSMMLHERFLAEAQAGILKINSATANANAQAPFAGWKSSGIGPAEHGIANREFYTRIQAVYGA
jgi:acyl-CoA reductase-like NAD-dependent aldehyde dehydrogenase